MLDPDAKTEELEELDACPIHGNQDEPCKPRPDERGGCYRLGCIKTGFLRTLWCYLASTLTGDATLTASVELPLPPHLVIPTQTALMRDDGKERLSIVLRDVTGITPRAISVKLVLKNSDSKSYEFPAEAITPDATTQTLALQFPSPAKWKLGTIDLNQSHLYIEPRPESLGCSYAADKIASHSFDVLLAEAAPEKGKQGFELRAIKNEIVVDKTNGVGSVKLVFDNFTVDNAILTWSGAEVKSAKDSDNIVHTPLLEKLTIKKATVLTMEIQTAKPEGNVTFTATGFNKDGEKIAEETKTFSVVAGK
jgi:hypothetical protein